MQSRGAIQAKGAQFTGEDWQRFLRERDIVSNMSR